MSTDRPKSLVLVSLPWSRRGLPSAAMAALAAWVRQERPEIEVTCRSEFLEVSERVGAELYDQLASSAMRLGELTYLAILHPERRAAVRAHFVSEAPGKIVPPPEAGPVDHGELFDTLYAILDAHLEELAIELSDERNLAVGLTTCFGQLFPNVALAAALKRRGATVPVVVGGSSVSARVGPSLLECYGVVDYIVQGEGERPLVALLDAIASGETERASELPAVLTKDNAARLAAGAELWEVDDMNVLPVPEYDEYAEHAERLDLNWILPIEGARGCWYDRRAQKKNPKASCYFCNIGVQWRGYREKSAERVVRELDVLTARYQNLDVLLLEPVQRLQGLSDFIEGIEGLERDFAWSYELRANIDPHDVLRLYEAGLREVQFGVEGLSTSLLNRVRKGTKTIHNLQALRLCAELGIEHLSNLIIDFPGSTAEEVEETLRVIRLARGYAPLRVSGFSLEMGSTVELLPDEFGIENARNPDDFRVALPEAIYERLTLMERACERSGERADWTAVVEACAEWARLHAASAGRALLRYRDGGTFLTIEDERFGDFRSGTLPALDREIYLYCTQNRPLAMIEERFGDVAPERIAEILAELVEHELMYEEGGRYLSLAVAAEKRTAARRIRALHAEAEVRAALRDAKKSSKRHLQLVSAG